MDKLVIVCVAIFFLLITLGLIIYISYSRKKTYNELREKYKKELEEDLQETYQKLVKAQEELTCSTNEAAEAFSYLQSILKDIDEKKEFNETLYTLRETELNKLIETKKQAEFEKIDKEVDEWAESAQEAATFYAEQVQKGIQKDIENGQKELNNLTTTINDYKARRDTINQEILRARAIEEQQDFYRIQIDDKSKEDIAFLLSIIDRFNNKEIIYKLIWSEYIQKPFKNMLNRVLGNKDPKNVIYMIKNMDTNEIYIGKTKAEVSKRWTEHVKTSLNIGTISRTNIHKALFNNWDKFAFTVLEEVPAETNLGDREKYYIKFYESDVFGYNIKSGG